MTFRSRNVLFGMQKKIRLTYKLIPVNGIQSLNTRQYKLHKGTHNPVSWEIKKSFRRFCAYVQAMYKQTHHDTCTLLRPNRNVVTWLSGCSVFIYIYATPPGFIREGKILESYKCTSTV